MDFNYKYNVNDTYMITSYTGSERKVVVPDTYYGRPVTILYDGVFKGHSELEEVILPETLVELGGFVFDGCDHLKQILLPDGLAYLWQYAFVRSGIESIILPGCLKRIPAFAFQECRNLETVTGGEGLQVISSWAFRDCGKLRHLNIPSGTVIHDHALPENTFVQVHRRETSENNSGLVI